VSTLAKRGHPRGSLTIVGTGIGLVGQATLEAVASIERSDRVLYLVTNPVTEAWLRDLNPAAISLADCYSPGKPRLTSYDEMVERILGEVRTGRKVCVALYGHPGVFVDPSHRAITRAREEGFPARMLPGVSAEDCLFADLGMDPAMDGCQSFEATDFLERHRRFDASSSLVLWQITAIRQDSVGEPAALKRKGVLALRTALARTYPASHEVIVYEASQLPICEPTILRVPLRRLGRVKLPPMATLYVPPLRRVRDRTRAGSHNCGRR
jgi:uncharacterized protein YabN with tetrapyrrole methylase and pyrophosphatase domain